jgi:arabinofuranosyltransferase
MQSLTSPAYLNSPAVQRGLVLIAAVGCTAIVLYYGWISDDGFITFRYVRNLLDGHGPVYNVGDRVQGYTHPLWLLLLIPVHAVVGEPVLTASILGGALTFVAVAYTGFFILRRYQSPRALVFFGLLAALLASSEAWRSFQTSGLENSLSNLLIAVLLVELFRAEGPRILAMTLLCSLLALTRPDLMLLVGPLGAYIALRAVREGAVRELIVASLPVLVWAAFALLYYGTVVPNTASAKLGNATLAESVSQGLKYLIDWSSYEPGSAVLLAFCAWAGLRLTATLEQRLFALGSAIYFVYVIAIGGDFMRGRFFVPLLTAAAGLGVLVLLDVWSVRITLMQGWLMAAMLAGIAVLNLASPAPGLPRFNHGIVNEREFFQEMSLRRYLADGEIKYAIFNVEQLAELNRFAEACGPFGIRSPTAGAFSYFARPEITVIDIHGLNDRYIANLDDSYLSPRQRVGHPSRRIPMSYLASRSDISIFEDWQEAVRERDCEIIAATQRYTSEEAGSSSTGGSPVFKSSR